MQDWSRLIAEADAAGFRLEIVQGIPTWETFPVARHQREIRRIQDSFRPTNIGDAECRCITYADVQIRFPDGTRKRPDISVFCREPDEQDSEITLIPEAVIEVLSKDYEAKDLIIGVPFYRQIGIKDVIVLDPISGEVKYYPKGKGEILLQSPTTITLACGCTCTV